LPVYSGVITVNTVSGPIVNEAWQVRLARQRCAAAPAPAMRRRTALACAAASQTVGPWVSQVIRLWANTSYADMQWTVGGIPDGDGLGKEVIARYTTGWNTNATWYTDSNGRDFMQ